MWLNDFEASIVEWLLVAIEGAATIRLNDLVPTLCTFALRILNGWLHALSLPDVATCFAFVSFRPPASPHLTTLSPLLPASSTYPCSDHRPSSHFFSVGRSPSPSDHRARLARSRPRAPSPSRRPCALAPSLQSR